MQFADCSFHLALDIFFAEFSTSASLELPLSRALQHRVGDGINMFDDILQVLVRLLPRDGANYEFVELVVEFESLLGRLDLCFQLPPVRDSTVPNQLLRGVVLRLDETRRQLLRRLQRRLL